MAIYNIYCDESRHTSDPSQHFIVIGALQCLREDKQRVVHRIHNLMAMNAIKTEFGWKKVSPNKENFYRDIIQLFIEEEGLTFRCIVIDRRKLNHEHWNGGDKELGFYKLYYQLLVHWLQPRDTYHIYLDWQQNSSSTRFEDLRQILIHKLNGRAKISCLEPVESDTQPLIQLSDLIIGAVGYSWNSLNLKENSSELKKELVNTLASSLNKPDLNFCSLKNDRQFNIFNWQGR